MRRPSDYCELGRRFVQFKPTGDVEDYVASSYYGDLAFLGRGSVGWEDLQAGQGVSVILGEPGSGRSYEFKAQAQALSDQEKFGFYLELHKLLSTPGRDLLDESEKNAFAAWEQSFERATFFLDAVDEAKLERVSDFQAALEAFSKLVGLRLERARIFISSRISEWLPDVDLRLVSEILGGPTSRDLVNARSVGALKTERAVEVYVIGPLGRDQVVKFALSKAVPNVSALVGELDATYSWEFAGRPLDADFVFNYWKTNRRIGSLSEMIEESVVQQLRERPEKEERAIRRPLSQGEARRGAENLAAASVLCRTLDFSVSGRASGVLPVI